MKYARIQRATQLFEIHQACQPRPLRSDELDEFFEPTADARDETISRRDRMRKILTRNPDVQSKLLLAVEELDPAQVRSHQEVRAGQAAAPERADRALQLADQ